MGALDSTYDDGSDDYGSDDASQGALSVGSNPLSGLDRGALQKYVSAAGDTSDMHAALDRVAAALKTDRKANQVQSLFALAGALGAPTRTGSIGETAGNVGKVLGETLGQQNTAQRQNDATLAKLQLDEAKSELSARRALGVQAMKAMSAKQPQSTIDKEAGKIILGAPDAQGRQSAFRKELTPDGQLTFRLIRILQPGETIPGVSPAPAKMLDEGDIAPGVGVKPEALAAATPDGTMPLRPAQQDTPPQSKVSGLPADLDKKFGLAARSIDVSKLDPDTPITLDLATGDITPQKGFDPMSKYGELTGSALMERLAKEDPHRAAEVQAILDGRLLAPTTGARAKDADTLLKLATAVDPLFDAGVGKAKFATRQAYAPGGKIGQNFIAIDTTVNHLAKLAKDVEDIDNLGGLATPLNPVKNFMSENTGHASPTNFKREANAVANESMKVFRGGGSAGSTKDIEEWRQSLPENGSPKQQQDAVKGFVDLLAGRYKPMVEQWNKTMGQDRSFLSFLSPSSRSTLLKLNPDYKLTDDDASYINSQTAADALKHKAAPVAAVPTAVPAGPNPSNSPVPTKLPSGLTANDAIAQARAAVKAGKPSKPIADRLRSLGIDSSKIDNFEAWASKQGQ